MEILRTGRERLTSYRFGLEIVEHVPELSKLWNEIQQCIESISDEDIIDRLAYLNSIKKRGLNKSIAPAINSLMDERLKKHNWTPQSSIFASTGNVGSMMESTLVEIDASGEYEDSFEDYKVDLSGKKTRTSAWTLDFSKQVTLKDGKISGIAAEVAFNHGEAASWNLVKPVLAAEVNDRRIQTNIGEGIGVVVVASSDMKRLGNFDGATGDFNRYLKTLDAMRSQLTTPLILIPLGPPKKFYIQRKSNKAGAMPAGSVILTS